jgi:integrase
MATVNFKLQSKSDNAPIYLVLSAGRGKIIYRKTGKIINYRDWSGSTNLPKQSSPHLKNLTKKLRKLKVSILNNIDDSKASSKEELSKWLEYQIDLHFGRIKEEVENNSLVDFIQYTIDNADVKVLRGGKMGLSKNRVKGYITFKGMIEKYQKHIKKEILLTDINAAFEDDFKNWLLKTKKYSKNYAGKNFDNLKAVCNEAQRLGKDVDSHAKQIRTFSENKDDRDVVTLSFDELEVIEKLEGLTESLQNVRKWLLFGCEIGQRGGDLLNITKKNLSKRDGSLFIDIRQEKSPIHVPIIIKPNIKKLLSDGFPYKISSQKFNKYLKDLCFLAGIDTMTEGKVYDKEKKRKVRKYYPKHELISSHTCRRSFATNYYKQIPTPLIMATTGHSKESTFLKYIGEKEDKDEDAKLFYKYAMAFEKERQEELNRAKVNEEGAKMNVVKKAN